MSIAILEVFGGIFNLITEYPSPVEVLLPPAEGQIVVNVPFAVLVYEEFVL